MSAMTVRGLLLAILIGAAMVVGVLLAAPSKANSEQDYIYFSLLEDNGMTIKSPAAAKQLAYAICGDLERGRDWRLIVTDVMNGADWTSNDASTVVAAAIVAYCPQFDPRKEAAAGQVA